MDCYEKLHNKTLHSHRWKIRLQKGKKSKTKKFCPTCNSELGMPIAAPEGAYIYSCNNCERGNKLKRIHEKTFSNSSTDTSGVNPSCPSCKSWNTQKKGFRGSKQRYICMDCNQNWTKESSTKKRISLEDKISRITKAKKEHLAIEIKYKGHQRTIHPYATNETYCSGYCNYRNELRTFRIDRMTEIKTKDKFEYDNGLQTKAEANINSASSYRGY